MESLNSVNIKRREIELQETFSDVYRRIWIQYTRFNNVVITVFPKNVGGDYRMFFAKNVQDFSLENLRNIVLSQM